MASPNNGRKNKMPKIPRSIIIMYILMALVLLGICAGIFIVLFSNETEKNKSTSSPFSLIQTNSDESKNPPLIVSGSAESSTESSLESSSESASQTSSKDESSSSAESSNGVSTILSQNFDKEFFADDLFIGDSISTGLHLYSYLDIANVAAAVGLTPYGAQTKILEDKGMTAVEYAKQMQPKRVFIMIGSNALSGGSQNLGESYRELVSAIIGSCPDSEICCISITPTARKTDYTNVDNAQVREVNKIIKSMCSELGLEYCDFYSMICDEDGYFLDEYAEVDGMHFMGKTYAVLLSALEQQMSE